MRRRGVALLVALIALGAGKPTAADPLQLSAMRSAGGLDVSSDWRVHLRGTQLTVERFDKPVQTRTLTSEQLHALDRALSESAFADLRPGYGCHDCSDMPFCTIEAGPRSVTLFAYAGPAPGAATAEGRALRRFYRVWQVVKELAGLDAIPDHCRQPREKGRP